jgi:uncharacterized membrane protein
MTAMRPPLHSLDRHFALPQIHHITADRPLAWLGLGWQDMQRNPIPSLAYGLLFAICGDVVLVLTLPHPHLFMVALSGFFLIAPLLAGGLYEISRQLSAGRQITFIESLAPWRQKNDSMAMLGLTLAIVGLTWERVSAVLFAIFAGNVADMQVFVQNVLHSGGHTTFIALWLLAGAILALLVFSLTVVAVPMLLDRDTDIATAMMTSLRATALNLEVLILWAAIIVALTLLGFATLLFGLIVLMPLLGHASWHAYREIVADR